MVLHRYYPINSVIAEKRQRAHFHCAISFSLLYVSLFILVLVLIIIEEFIFDILYMIKESQQYILPTIGGKQWISRTFKIVLQCPTPPAHHTEQLKPSSQSPVKQVYNMVILFLRKWIQGKSPIFPYSYKSIHKL